jgi:hypothetical protein
VGSGRQLAELDAPGGEERFWSEVEELLEFLALLEKFEVDYPRGYLFLTRHTPKRHASALGSRTDANPSAPRPEGMSSAGPLSEDPPGLLRLP